MYLFFILPNPVTDKKGELTLSAVVIRDIEKHKNITGSIVEVTLEEGSGICFFLPVPPFKVSLFYLGILIK